MDIWMIISGMVTATAICIMAAVIFVYRRNMRMETERLHMMLDSAINGDFSENMFDESVMSALETKMARFLAANTTASRDLAAEKDKIKELISDISHQTKTPISNILLYSQILSEQELSKDGTICVNALSAQAEKLDFLIGALVKMSRLETGIITVNTQRGSVEMLLNDVIEQIHTNAEAKEIAIEKDIVNGDVYFDSKWTGEAIYNVIENAVKYAPPKSKITITAIPYELFYRIDIADQGMGIAEDEQNKIFSRFYRSTSVRGQEGVGIGLFLTRKIITSGGGYIKVSSEPDKGSVFSVFLPTEKG